MFLPLAFLMSEMAFLVHYTTKNFSIFILRISAWSVRLHLTSFDSVVGRNSHGGESTLRSRGGLHACVKGCSPLGRCSRNDSPTNPCERPPVPFPSWKPYGEVLSTFLSGARGASRRQRSLLSHWLVAPRSSSWRWPPLSNGKAPVLSLWTSKHVHYHPALPAATLLPA